MVAAPAAAVIPAAEAVAEGHPAEAAEDHLFHVTVWALHM
jgi:hypothetical protein